MIEAENLSKDYVVHLKGKGLSGMVRSLVKSEKKIVPAVQNVNLSIAEGELVGYIGPNGAGKSTTIKMLTGILQPSSGYVSICGIDPAKNRIQNARNIGVVFGQKTQLFWDLPVRETFDLLRRMYQIDGVTYRRNVDDFMDFLEMGSFVDQPVRQLSLGQRMRAEIAAALLHDPKVLFLDEPTIGLDINVKIKMREFIQKINQERRVTVLLTTHDLADIESLARRIIVINHGTVGFDGRIETLAEKYAKGKRRIRFTLLDETVLQFPEKIQAHLEMKRDGRCITLLHDSSLDDGEILSEILSQASVSDIHIQGPQIEDVVLEAYKS